MPLPNAIIAGTNKAGTTSLFRYLCAHPAVCGSRVKEVCFFSRLGRPAQPAELADYASYFRDCSTAAPVRLEASPTYLFGGRPVAQAIGEALPGVRLIMLLRDPVDRLLSYYRRNIQRDNPMLRGLSLDQFVDLALTADIASGERGDSRIQAIWERLNAGCYAPKLREYLSVFPVRHLGIWFFDDLADNPARVMREVCMHLDIAPDFYADYHFAVENKTRHYRLRGLHRALFSVNRRLQPWLNRHPAAARRLKAAYQRVNERQPTVLPHGASPQAVQRLRRYYAAFNHDLATLLPQHYPDIPLPSWIRPSPAR